MRKIIEIDENEGLDSLLGKTVTFFCMNYFYTGELGGVNDTCVKLDNPKIVYETGPWGDVDWKDAQSLPGSIYIQTSAIESFGVMK